MIDLFPYQLDIRKKLNMSLYKEYKKQNKERKSIGLNPKPIATG